MVTRLGHRGGAWQRVAPQTGRILAAAYRRVIVAHPGPHRALGSSFALVLLRLLLIVLLVRLVLVQPEKPYELLEPFNLQ